MEFTATEVEANYRLYRVKWNAVCADIEAQVFGPILKHTCFLLWWGARFHQQPLLLTHKKE